MSTEGTLPEPPGWLPLLLCGVCAIPIALLGLLAALIQLLANMNLNFELSSHCLIFVVGWLTVACCFYSAYRLMRYSSYKSLAWVLISGGLLALDHWLYSQPAAEHLMH